MSGRLDHSRYEIGFFFFFSFYVIRIIFLMHLHVTPKESVVVEINFVDCYSR